MNDYIDFSRGPLPDVEDQETGIFWKGTRQGEIRFPKCRSCHKFHWYPNILCPYCHSADIEWQVLKSQPRLYSWSEVDTNGPMWNVGNRDSVGTQRIVGLVEFDEAPDLYLATDVVGCRPEEVYIGMPLEPVFQRVNDKVTMPLFKPLKK
jgi:uncharacterized protein